MAQEFRKQGYRVLEMSFVPFGLPTLNYYYGFGSENVKDPLALMKRDFPHYDVVVGNECESVSIELIDPELQQDFLSAEKTPLYEKNYGTKLALGGLLNEGLLLSEKDAWKRRKKILSEVFNFNFIKSLSPKIAGIGDQLLGSFDRGQKEAEYDVLEFTTEFGGTVMIECFFGESAKNEQIEGKSVNKFIKDLIGDLFTQTFTVCGLLFGLKFMKLGIRGKDRANNQKVNLFRSWGKEFVGKKMA